MHQSQVSPTPPNQQTCLQISLVNQHQTAPNTLEITKRSDDAEFQDWQITTIKSGKFIFNPIEKSIAKAIVISINKENIKEIQMKKIQIQTKLSQGTEIKVKERDSNKTFTSQSNRLIRLIFLHFCKENYISSMKSTLFQQKQKSMQVMNLNKWMVFCKEYDFLHKLTNASINMTLSKIHISRAKEMKEAESLLTNIFKRCSENQSKMKFQHFLQGIKMLHQKLREKFPQFDLQFTDFTKTYLFCSSQKECMLKLSSLKFTFRIPQIDYIVNHAKSISKSKYNLSSTKQNRSSIIRNRSTHILTKQAMKLNPIIRQAKNPLKIINKPSLQLNKKYITKIKLTQQPKQREKVNKADLQQYLDRSKDQILQAYFQNQTYK